MDLLIFTQEITPKFRILKSIFIYIPHRWTILDMLNTGPNSKVLILDVAQILPQGLTMKNWSSRFSWHLSKYFSCLYSYILFWAMQHGFWQRAGKESMLEGRRREGRETKEEGERIFKVTYFYSCVCLLLCSIVLT